MGDSLPWLDDVSHARPTVQVLLRITLYFRGRGQRRSRPGRLGQERPNHPHWPRRWGSERLLDETVSRIHPHPRKGACSTLLWEALCGLQPARQPALPAVRQRTSTSQQEHSSDYETQQPRVSRPRADDLAYAACLTHIFQRGMGGLATRAAKPL